MRRGSGPGFVQGLGFGLLALASTDAETGSFRKDVEFCAGDVLAR